MRPPGREHAPPAGVCTAAALALTSEGDTMARRVAALLLAVVLLALLLLILDHLGNLQR